MSDGVLPHIPNAKEDSAAVRRGLEPLVQQPLLEEGEGRMRMQQEEYLNGSETARPLSSQGLHPHIEGD